MANEKVRQAAKDKRVSQWEIAQTLGVCEQTVHRWLRLPLPAEKETEILEAIEAVAKGRG